MLDIFQPLFAEKGLVLIRWVEIGWLNMYGRKPLIAPKDAAGYRLRSQASEASQAMMASLDGDLLQMPFHDLVPALLKAGYIFPLYADIDFGWDLWRFLYGYRICCRCGILCNSGRAFYSPGTWAGQT